MVVREDGRCIGRGYREPTSSSRNRGWSSTIRSRFFRSSVEAMREAVVQSGMQPAALGITNQRETLVLWDRTTPGPSARPSSGRTGAPRRDAASCATPGPSR